MDCDIHAHFFQQAILTRTVGHTDLISGVPSCLLVGLRTQDYKSLCAAVMICATLVNIQTHTDRQHFDQCMWKAQLVELETEIFASELLYSAEIVTVSKQGEQMWVTNLLTIN